MSILGTLWITLLVQHQEVVDKMSLETFIKLAENVFSLRNGIS